MAKSVAIYDPNYASQLQMKNFLAPPEAIELAKLYNQLGEILKKPIKKRRKKGEPVTGEELDTFYMALHRVLGLMGRTELPPPPPPAQQPHQTREIETQTDLETQTPQEEEEDVFLPAGDDGETMISDPVTASTPARDRSDSAPLPAPPTHESAASDFIKVPELIGEYIAKHEDHVKLDTFKRKPYFKLIKFLHGQDPTFSFNTTKTFVVNGAKFRTTTMRKIVDVLKDADSTLENEFQDKDDLIPRNLLNKIKKLTMEAKDSAQTQIMTGAFPH